VSRGDVDMTQSRLCRLVSASKGSVILDADELEVRRGHRV
jgi:hypothetical protein